MNKENLRVVLTHSSTPTIACSPTKSRFPLFNGLFNLTLDLQSEPNYDQMITKQILFPGKENKEILKKSIAISQSLDNELNSLRTLILKQKFCKEFSQIDEKVAEKKDEVARLLSTLNVERKDTLETENQMIIEDEKVTEEKRVGIYTKVERLHKIRKYKEKLKRWRTLHPLSRNFEGRRRVAFSKARNNGRFAKVQ